VNEDKRKAQLMGDERLKDLQKLSTIDLMPRQHLSDFQNRLAGLKSCFALTEQEMEASPVCPHCNFKPVSEVPIISVSSVLDTLDDELDKLIENWTNSLLSNLGDPSVKTSLTLLKPDRRQQIQSFIKAKRLPKPVTADFIDVLSEALRGIKGEEISNEILKNVIFDDNVPLTIEEFNARINGWLGNIQKGRDPKTLRILFSGNQVIEDLHGQFKKTSVDTEGIDNDVIRYYENQPDGVQRIKRHKDLVEKLKRLYLKSQVHGDDVPDIISAKNRLSALIVHHVKPLSEGGTDERANMIVLTASMHALVHAAYLTDECKIDLDQKTIKLWENTISLTVDKKHNGV